MKLSTPIPIIAPELPYNYGGSFFNIGSCFASNLAGKLHYYGFKSLQNPIGILFHPFAIQHFFKCLQEEKFDKELFVESQGIWKSLQAHSQLQGENPEWLLFNLQKAVLATRAYLANANAIFITFGTAFVYQHLSTKKFVANCQKQNASLFKKQLIPIETLVKSINETVERLLKFNNANIYISVSPIRHLKDGLVENNRSKAHLLAAVHEVVAQRERVNYFPAYEIMLDELRDYRFYERDLLHPSQLAVDYVWEKFSGAFFDEKTKQIMHKVDKFRRLSAHRTMQKSKAIELVHQTKVASLKHDLLALEPRLQLD